MDNMTISAIILFGGGIIALLVLYLYIKGQEQKKHRH